MISFERLKTLVSSCICKTTVILRQKITEDVLNLLANEFTDKIMKEIKEKNNA